MIGENGKFRQKSDILGLLPYFYRFQHQSCHDKNSRPTETHHAIDNAVKEPSPTLSSRSITRWYPSAPIIMIIVFVVDTSPSMATKLVDIGMSKLDLAKMAVESLAKGLSKRVHEHNIAYAQAQQSLYNLGLGYAPQDQFLLLSTSRQFDNTAECGAGGRLLVGFTDYHTQDKAPLDVHSHSHQEFDRALKKLQASSFSAGEGAVGTSTIPFPEDAGGALGLNAALSAGLALLGRYRLQNRCTENFGMGRLPNNAMLLPSGQGAANAALQPACLVLLTDGECLKQKTPGGGLLELQFGNQPLREFYQEPFRWDQRIFCLAISTSTESSTQFLHPSLRALCDVTGGCHAMLRSTASLSQLTDQLVKLLAPPRPTLLPLEDPTAQLPVSASLRLPHGTYVQGGPICCFQGLEAGPNGEASPISRAMLLFTPHQTASAASAIPSPPIWWLPEAYFPNKALDSLPPRLAQPLLTYSRHYSVVGSNTFDPSVVAKQLGILDQLVLHNKQGGKVVQRDVYICEFLSPDGRPGQPPRGSSSSEYLPIAVRGAGRAMSEGEESMLNIGILHVPANVKSVIAGGSNSTLAKYATLTLLPPEPHILLPLLIKAAEAESRMLKKYPDKPRAVHLDDVWRSELRAYLFRIPPYYHVALKRCLRPILPASVQNLLSTDGVESLASQCFSKSCLQKIRAGELLQKENNERLERQERDLRRRGASEKDVTVGYGQYDPRGTKSNYLAALRSLPAPWKVGFGSKGSKVRDESAMSDVTSTVSESELRKTAADM
jgi:integrator complex subunit 6